MASSAQKRVLLGLESGRKLHELLSEPGMPSKALLQEWLDNPEFDREYSDATDKGRALRLARGGKPEAEEQPADPRPAALRGQLSPTAVEKGRALSQKLTELIGDGATYAQAPADAPAAPVPQPAVAPSPGPAGRMTTAEKQAQVLKQLASGVLSTEVKVRGYSEVVLAQWRKDTNFLLHYDQAKKKGFQVRKAATKPAPAATQLVAEPTGWEGFIEECNRCVQAGEIALSDMVGLTLCDSPKLARAQLDMLKQKGRNPGEESPSPVAPEAEPAPNQSEPVPVPAKAKPERLYATVLGIPEASQKWMTYEEALRDAEYRAKTQNRPCYVARVVTETMPAVTVREL